MIVICTQSKQRIGREGVAEAVRAAKVSELLQLLPERVRDGALELVAV